MTRAVRAGRVVIRSGFKRGVISHFTQKLKHSMLFLIQKYKLFVSDIFRFFLISAIVT